MRKAFWAACLAASAVAQRPVITDEVAAESVRQKYLAVTRGWAAGVTFTRAEREAMDRGKQWEQLMMTSLDDPLARRILAAGEPSFEALASYYPGKVLDRTLLGTYSDPARPARCSEEFVAWWNGAISANLLRARIGGNVRQIAENTNILFRVGQDAQIFGASGEDYTGVRYEDGYLPIVTAGYKHDGLLYEETALADNPQSETKSCDIAYVRLVITNASEALRTAELQEDFVLIDGTKARSAGQKIVDASGATLVVHSDPQARFDEARQRLTHRFRLRPGEKASVFLKIPYWPDAVDLLQDASQKDFEAAHRRVREFWLGLLSRGAAIQVPEKRVNDVWRGLLLQNFILADGPRFTYGSGLRYNDSYFPVENGFGGHTFALFGFQDYANALLPYCIPVSVYRDQAGRKYQNRRALPFHHVFENYRISKKTDVFERYKQDLYRVAEEIIADRRTTMGAPEGAKPLHWGFLPPDKPGVDAVASTQTVYVTAHNITNCQGLQDFGEFLVRTGADPESGRRYIGEAKQYRKRILEAMEQSAIRLPGRPPFVDLQTLYFRETPEYGPEPYDDLAGGRLQGTYYHYWVDMQLHFNFFNPADQVGQWMADYVAQRGGFVLGCTRARSPGWINSVYNGGYYNYRLRSGQVEQFLLGFYSQLAFAMSRRLYVSSEGSPFTGYNSKNGGLVDADYSFPNSAANAEMLSMLRSMLILEELEDNRETGDIWLLKGVPRAWLEDGKQIRVVNAPTYFGDISFEVASALKRNSVTASIQPPARDPYRHIVLVLRHPRSVPIRSVTVNGRTHADFDPQQGAIRLAAGPRAFKIEVSY